MTKTISVAPSARRLTTSLRDIGYSFESAIADLVDNSIAANASEIDINITFDGRESSIRIVDNGDGMSESGLDEAMRFGSRRSYDEGELGRYGLGLKTASLSQCRRLEVMTAHASASRPFSRALDLDFIRDVDKWLTLDTSDDPSTVEAAHYLSGSTGTVVTWHKLDRLLTVKSPESGWARRRIEALGPKAANYLSMVFHRFLSGEAEQHVRIRVNDQELEAWDPFARHEIATKELTGDKFEIEHEGRTGTVTLKRYLLPTRDEFSSAAAFDDASGIEKWNRQQGLYIYRADRLVQWGGWAGIRTIDEHTKLARASLDFGTDLDEAFNINVAKMRVTIPSQLKKMLARPINELCIEADAAYRRSVRNQPVDDELSEQPRFDFGSEAAGDTIGLALRAAAARTGKLDALEEIAKLLRTEMPELADHLGFS